MNYVMAAPLPLFCCGKPLFFALYTKYKDEECWLQVEAESESLEFITCFI